MTGDPSGGQPNILLVTIDSLRADHVYSNAAETPSLDRLVERGRSYSTAFAQGPFTTFSMPSLFTSQYPSDLQYTELTESTIGVSIGDNPTIGTVLCENGYETAGFHSNPLLSNLFGFDRGFDVFDARLPMDGIDALSGRTKVLADKLLRLVRKHPYLPAEKLTQRGLDWLDSRDGDEPFFLWLHYMDVHGPYQPKSGNSYWNKYRGERLWRKAVTSPTEITDDERETLRAWYREEVTYTDRCLGRFLDGLRERDQFADTVVAVTADHGEQFGEHGTYSHPHQLYDELLHVPLVFAGPDCDSTTVDEIVELTDIAPTLATMAGSSVPDAFVGDPLPGFDDRGHEPADDRTSGDGVAIAEANLVPDYAGCVRTDRWKYIRDGDSELLFDLSADPTEQTDIGDDEEARRAELAEHLDDHLAVDGRSAGSDGSVATVDIDGQGTEERLKDLGYLE
ncbi:sulfatase [Salinibaculum rarum]|uniref:sulfatase n=1 Tax=Salinibaculum rarum TaxID=3058903 RepID=UPI00265E6006|nr:sulfatase [Salinibaculum sp. KK48]